MKTITIRDLLRKMVRPAPRAKASPRPRSFRPTLEALETRTVPSPVVTGVSPNYGPVSGGTAVEIIGSGFTGATAVSFGGALAGMYMVQSDTAIEAWDPGHAAGVVDVTVSTPSGTSPTSSADQFTYGEGLFTVTKTVDDGTAGTLRYALQQLNLSFDPTNIIDFAIGAYGSPQTLTLNNSRGPLPSIMNPVIIDGYSQGSSSSGPLIQLSGAGTTTIDGLISLSGGVTIQDLAITGFMGNGIVLNTASSSGADIVRGCYLGTDGAGDSGLGDLNGVDILGGSGNTIGGPNPADRNVISGNRQSGVLVVNSGSVITNDWIGVGPSGTAALGNAVDGVDAEASDTTVSDSVISANGQDGIDAALGGDLIAGDWIGVDATGKNALGNGTGVLVTGANDTVGDATGATTNIISGNLNDGIDVSGAGATGALITYCWVGVDGTGLAALGNGAAGVNVAAGPTSGNIFQNVISGQSNGQGVNLLGQNWVVAGNYIGVGANGVTPVANATGVTLDDPSSNCTIGLEVPGLGNIISGNTGNGMLLQGSTNDVVANNYIGLDVHGNVQGNGQFGVVLTIDPGTGKPASGNTIGGTHLWNVISGNAKSGVIISNGATKNVVAGNLIGTNWLGTGVTDGNGKPTGNGFDGVTIQNTATANTVGGTGTASGPFNVISGNVGSGVLITDDGTSNNLVAEDYIGTTLNGSSVAQNGTNGVTIQHSASNNTVGVVAVWQNQNGKNVNTTVTVISGNAEAGVAILTGCNSNQVINCYIGTDASGATAIGNLLYGIDLEGSSNTIGGQLDSSRDVISGNGTGAWVATSGFGIYVTGAGATNNVIEDDYIGTDYSGTQPLGNNNSGVYVSADGGGNTIGGAAAGAGCVISSNGIMGKGGYGVDLTTSTGETVQGDSIGVDAKGAGGPAMANIAGWLNGDQTKNTVKNNRHQ